MLLQKIKLAVKKAGPLTAATMLGGLASYALASIPDPSGIIHACYGAGGAVRIVESSTDCTPTETHLTWNQTGPQGSTGATGATGPQGPQGPAGEPIAYGYIDGNTGGFDSARSKNVVSVTKVTMSNGYKIYCIDLSEGTVPKIALASADADYDSGTGTIIAGVGPYASTFSSYCSSADDLGLVNYDYVNLWFLVH